MFWHIFRNTVFRKENLFVHMGGECNMAKIEVGEVFTISDENDQEQEVEVLATLTLEGTDYAAVGFADDIRAETEDDIDIFFLKVDEEGDLAAIESDEEFDKVSTAFDALMDEEE
jgi:uncharacterized protein YrzB (UPF0473 family)